MTTRHHLRALVACLALWAAACGQDDGQTVAATADPARDEVIEAFGEALSSRELDAVIDLLEPAMQERLEGSQGIRELSASMAAFEEMNDSGVDPDLSWEIVSEEGSSVFVEYAGEMCGPTFVEPSEPATPESNPVTETIPPTTYVEGPDSPPSTSFSSAGGTWELGETVCSDVSEGWEPLMPFEFVRTDGEWYATWVADLDP